MEDAGSCETSIYYQTTQRHYPEENNYGYRRDNLKCLILVFVAQDSTYESHPQGPK
jgi:hypothetical protein